MSADSLPTKRFLLEIGVEELPASFVRGALDAMPKLAEDMLRLARLPHGAIRALGTPRRLTLVVEDLAAGQEDLSEKVFGPPVAAAFESDGTPKKGAIGFAKKLGIPVEALVVEETDKGAYVVGVQQAEGRAAAAVLPDLLATLVSKIPFRKSMRWGDGEFSFGRPVHWIVCLHGSDVVDVSLFGVRAGRASRGHRFLAPADIELADSSSYVDALRDAHVLVDPAERERVMRERLQAAAQEAGGALVADEFLIGENMSLVEEPHVICGSFEDAFLALPDQVTIEVMRGHQRYFALRDASTGRLLPRYLAVLNTSLAPDIITKGNDRVLRARLADAQFFLDEDRKVGLEGFLPRLDQVVFQAKLGTVGERVKRYEAIVQALGDDGTATRAARLCKADLVSLIVGEFPELQGIMGRWYALREGVDAEVADAIEGHYRPRGASDDVPTAVTSARLAVADRADVLVGCFGLGMVPTGSTDPFALRRATLGVVRIALEGPIDVDLSATLAAAYAAYRAQDKPVGDEATVLATLEEFFRGRLRAHLGEQRSTDLVDACLGAWPGTSIRDLAARLDALEAFRKLEAFDSFAVAFKRAYNIAKDAPDAPVDASLLTEDAERALAERWAAVEATIAGAVERGEYVIALTAVAEQLREPIDRFFDEVLVMVDDAPVRENRLRLLGRIARRLGSIAHFHVLEHRSGALAGR